MIPTYLYLKQHATTGKLYFGKTTQNPEIYNGSGLYWKRHINKHGEHIDTLWYCLFFEEKDLVETALLLSDTMNIVESTGFANMKPENGLDGAVANYSTYKDEIGTKYYLHVEDPKIRGLGLVGNNTGYTMTDEMKEHLRRGKDSYRVTKLYYINSTETKSICHGDKDYEQQLEDALKLGWLVERTDESRELAKQRQKTAASEALTGTTTFYYPSGVFYGRIPKDSPIIKELGLVHIRSEKQLKQNASRGELAVRALSGSTRYNNGTIEISAKEHPGEGWFEGRLPRDPEHDKNQKAASAKMRGATTWNDGLKNYFVYPGEKPKDGWTRGMKPRTKVNTACPT